MEPPSQLRISIKNLGGRPVPASLIRRAIQVVNARYPIGTGSIALLITDDDQQRSLNQTFRGVDAPTDVLTFPAQPIPGSGARQHLGDISISRPHAERQARHREASFADEVTILAIHGALHLAGLDDESEADQAEMRLAMGEIAREVGVSFDSNWATLPAPSEAIV